MFSVPGGRLALVDPTGVEQQAKRYFSTVQKVAVNRPPDGLKAFANKHYGQTEQMPQILKGLGAEKYYFVCRKTAAQN